MTRTDNWRTRGCLAIVLLAMAWPVRAKGVEDFKLSQAIPADAMLVVQCREHAGRAFVNEQCERVWAAVEKQGFDRDFKRLLRGMIKQQDGDLDAFDAQWQQMADLLATVTWSELAAREFAFAIKLGLPMGADFVVLLMPPADQVGKNFDALGGLLKQLVSMAPPEMLALASEGEGEIAMHRVSVAGQIPPISLTLARQKDVIVIGFGSLVDQSLALLSGEAQGAGATLASTERFKLALGKLPPPQDSFFYMDFQRWFGQVRGFTQMAAAAAGASDEPTTQPTTDAVEINPAAFLPKLIDELDIFDYIASVESTAGMKTDKVEVAAVREEGKSRALFKLLYGNPPLREPLKYVPKDATSVSVGSGPDLAALYKAALDFVKREIPDGQALLDVWTAKQQELNFDVEQDLLTWFTGSYVQFTSQARGAYVSDWLLMFPVRDDAKAQKTLDDLLARANELGQQHQQFMFDEPRDPELAGFKVFVQPLLAMLIGQPVIGVKAGHLFVGSSEKIVQTALKTGTGEQDNFTKSERFAAEGLPLGENVTAFSFEDQTKYGEELGQMLSMVGGLLPLLPAEVQKDPTVTTILSVVTKIGRVAKQLNFYRSTCEVETFDGQVNVTKSVTHYQEPPKKAPETAPTEETPTAPGAETKK
jgi:hypothetical protein